MKQPPLSRAEVLDLKSILERAIQTAERNNRIDHAERLAREIAELDYELQGMQ